MDGNKSNPNDQQFISFQDFSPVRSGGQALLDIGIPDQQPYNSFSPQPPAGNISNTENLQQDSGQDEATSSPSFWTVKYYRKFFRVTTNDVVERIKKSMVPIGSENYLITHIRPNPDLYGPIWICITLIFAIAISGNIANYFQTAHTGNYHWKYNFHLVSQSATCILLYAWLLPLAIWGALKWTEEPQNAQDGLIESNSQLGLLEIICLYGYSLFIYIPVAFLWTIQISFLQWALVGVAAFLSGGILLRSLLPVINGKYKFIYVGVILGMHLLLAIGFIVHFFHMPHKTVNPPEPHPNLITSTLASIVNETKAL